MWDMRGCREARGKRRYFFPGIGDKITGRQLALPVIDYLVSFVEDVDAD